MQVNVIGYICKTNILTSYNKDQSFKKIQTCLGHRIPWTLLVRFLVNYQVVLNEHYKILVTGAWRVLSFPLNQIFNTIRTEKITHIII